HSRRPTLILVSALTPTRYGEGKTTTSIGLADALTLLGQRAAVALREPSLGPCFGVKGGGTGGGKSQLHPSVDINLHFTGDLHAISSAHNLLAAAIDNKLHRGSTTLDSRRVLWPRAIDMNDRALRQLVGSLGDNNGVPRESSFLITAASEVMAALAMAEDADDLRARLGRILIGFTPDGEPVFAESMNVTGAMMALLRDALWPNLVQTGGGTPAIVHAGPFANIAHGCNSVIATKTALHLADIVVTEAGFGFDLGGEKFLDLKCRTAGLNPDLVVLVATVRALKHHGGMKRKQLETPDPEAVERGLANLDAHIDAAAAFGKQAVVAVNGFATDSDDERRVIKAHCEARGVRVAMATHFLDGGRGALELGQAVLDSLPDEPTELKFSYDLDASAEEKLLGIARRSYGATSVNLTAEAKRDLKQAAAAGCANLPICVAKTHSSLSDNARLRGRPEGQSLTVRRFVPTPGAGFLVALAGDIMRMPGLPAIPAAEHIDLEDGEVTGLA
ncbi:MAG: formate--tetrahydrofolate ligase, partial [Myxococcota bacterium]